MALTIAEIAQRFAEVVRGRSDPAFVDLFADKVAVRHVYDEQYAEMDGRVMAEMSVHEEAGFKRLMPDYQPAEPRVFCGDDGFALVRSVSGTLPDGAKIHYPFCAVVTVQDGRIVRIDAYQDRAQAEPLGKAMQALLGQAEPAGA